MGLITQTQLGGLWTTSLEHMFSAFGQTVTWKGDEYTIVLDDLPAAAQQRQDGGGFLPDFSGTMVFRKTDFSSAIPKAGDRVSIGSRAVRITEVSCAQDPADPTIMCAYAPVTT